jgi:hypothetical protein
MAAVPVYCKNHPSRETLLRCNRCNDPYCIHCLVRTPVGYRCKACLHIQQAGYYNATVFDHVIAGIAGFSASIIGGAIAVAIGGFFLLFQIFYAPAAGSAISEIISRTIGKRRGRRIWLVACAAFFFGSFIGAIAFPFFAALLSGVGLLGAIIRAPLAAIFNLGFWIYLVLAIGTVYARLR